MTTFFTPISRKWLDILKYFLFRMLTGEDCVSPCDAAGELSLHQTEGSTAHPPSETSVRDLPPPLPSPGLPVVTSLPSPAPAPPRPNITAESGKYFRTLNCKWSEPSLNWRSTVPPRGTIHSNFLTLQSHLGWNNGMMSSQQHKAHLRLRLSSIFYFIFSELSRSPPSDSKIN